MFPEETDGEPRLEIIEHPKSRGFRFRYTCEGPSHGGIPGASSDKNKKTFPAVKIVNYQGYARIVVQLVTNEENPRLHPHSLVGKQCQNGICTVQCGPKDMTATFPNLGIQHVTKKNVATILEERYVAAEMQLSSINDGFPQEVQRNIKDEDRKRIAAKAQSEAKSIDLSVVRLMFIAYLPDSQGAFTIMLKPIISDAIFDSKAPNAATLKICRMDCNAGSAGGGDEVYLLCDKVQKDDIQVRFVEEDSRGNDVWEAYGSFCPTDVHRQFAIVFRTPAYKDQYISQPVNVNVQLRRKSDGEVSEPRPFTYLPNKTDYDMIDRKRRKVMPAYLDHIDGNNQQGFNYSNSSASNSVQGGYQFEGSSGSSNENVKKSQLKIASLSRRRPQQYALDPLYLQKKFPQREIPAQAPIAQEHLPGTQIPACLIQCPGNMNNTSSAQRSFPSSSCSQLEPTSHYAMSQPTIVSSTASNAHPCNVMAGAPDRCGITELQTGIARMYNDSTAIQQQQQPRLEVVTTGVEMSAQPVDVTMSLAGNDVSLPALSMTSTAAQSTTTLQHPLPEFNLDDIFGVIESDGVDDTNHREKEYDFASALYCTSGTTSPTDSSSIKAHDQLRSSTGAEIEDPDIECDFAATVTKDLGKLSLDRSSSCVLQDPSPKITEEDENFGLEPSAKTEKQRSDPNPCTLEPATPTRSLEARFKLAEARKMAVGMHNYSITGDVRNLLYLQRHLASARDENGDTVLHLAVIHDHTEVLRSLLDVVGTLDNGEAILNSINERRETPLQLATISDNVDAVIDLLGAGADPLIPDLDGNHAVHVACRHGNADVLSRLLRSKRIGGQEVDTCNYAGLSCSHLVISAKSNLPQCLGLIKPFCDVESRERSSGKTALHLAVERENVVAIGCLLSECDADVHALSYNGISPLDSAVSQDNIKIASLLLACGADPDAEHLYKEAKPIDLARSDEMRDLLEGNLPLNEDESDGLWSDVRSLEEGSLLHDDALRTLFCELINIDRRTGSNWYQLADRLQLSHIKSDLQQSDNPTALLLQNYSMCHGTVDGLRSALLSIGRHDAIQVLNHAILSDVGVERWNDNIDNLSTSCGQERFLLAPSNDRTNVRCT